MNEIIVGFFNPYYDYPSIVFPIIQKEQINEYFVSYYSSNNFELFSNENKSKSFERIKIHMPLVDLENNFLFAISKNEVKIVKNENETKFFDELITNFIDSISPETNLFLILKWAEKSNNAILIKKILDYCIIKLYWDNPVFLEDWYMQIRNTYKENSIFTKLPILFTEYIKSQGIELISTQELNEILEKVVLEEIIHFKPLYRYEKQKIIINNFNNYIDSINKIIELRKKEEKSPFQRLHPEIYAETQKTFIKVSKSMEFKEKSINILNNYFNENKNDIFESENTFIEFLTKNINELESGFEVIKQKQNLIDLMVKDKEGNTILIETFKSSWKRKPVNSIINLHKKCEKLISSSKKLIIIVLESDKERLFPVNDLIPMLNFRLEIYTLSLINGFNKFI